MVASTIASMIAEYRFVHGPDLLAPYTSDVSGGCGGDHGMWQARSSRVCTFVEIMVHIAEGLLALDQRNQGERRPESPPQRRMRGENLTPGEGCMKTGHTPQKLRTKTREDPNSNYNTVCSNCPGFSSIVAEVKGVRTKKVNRRAYDSPGPS